MKIGVLDSIKSLIGAVLITSAFDKYVVLEESSASAPLGGRTGGIRFTQAYCHASLQI